ncbi:hypothetical protein [Scytonema sp. UIC 10036]|uniref:hypothetical protein n=1 Tax=Scytonema sp. UIC 10036 TaxID=2304196 RepID=UPI00325BEDF6
MVIRLSPRSNFSDWCEAIETLITGLEAADVTGQLWIIKNGNIQEYRTIEPENKN